MALEPEILLTYDGVLLVNDGKGNKLAGGNVQHLGNANATRHCNRCVLPTILERKNAQGFSLLVCLSLCIANILRVLFWLVSFRWPLQSAIISDSSV
uniref:Uncharacterized protein n=1 Tax=Parascaris equorum TaxID=6256 RepID=A0A914R8P6_PAREQ